MYRIFAALCLTLACLASHAVDVVPAAPPDEVETTVVVTATRTPEDVSTVPASVTVITRAEIEHAPAVNVDDLLRARPGVDIQRVVGMASGTPPSINLNGVPGKNRVLVLVDGLPLNGSGTDFISLNQIPLEIAQRIEIVRGPFSSLYGANAFGGVINVITLRGTGTPVTRVLGSAGNEGYWHTGLVSHGRTGRLRYAVNADLRGIDNYLARETVTVKVPDPVTHQPVLTEVPTVNYDYRDARMVGNIGYDLTDTARVTLQGRYFDNQLGYGQRYYLAQPRDTDNRERTWVTGLSYESHPSEQRVTRLTAYYRYNTLDLLSEGLSHYATVGPPSNPMQVPVFARTHGVQTCTDWQLAGQWTRRHGKHLLTTGAEFLRNDGHFPAVTDAATGLPLPNSVARDAHISNLAAYIQDDIRPGSRLRVVPGVRVDHHSAFGVAISPKVAASYQPRAGTAMRASVGRAFRAPTLSELYKPDWDVSPGITFRANPDLNPEYLWAYDAGIEHRFTNRILGQITLFHNDMRDLIDLVTDGAVLRYTNVARARSDGAQISVDWRGPDGLTAFANYTVQKVSNITTGDPLDYMPRHKGNVGMNLTRSCHGGTMTASFTENFVGRRSYLDWSTNQRHTLPGYWRTDLALTWARGVANLQLAVQNLFDHQYEETAGIPAPGRLYRVTLGMGF